MLIIPILGVIHTICEESSLQAKNSQNHNGEYPDIYLLYMYLNYIIKKMLLPRQVVSF
jgi:hypothetical protein